MRKSNATIKDIFFYYVVADINDHASSQSFKIETSGNQMQLVILLGLCSLW